VTTVPSTGAPTVADVVAALRHAPAARSPRPAPDRVLELLLGLHENNARQWDREDAARREDADDHAVAQAKRDIDALNRKRHDFVEAIDGALAAVIDQSQAAPPTTESPGMVFDRLSVLVLRIASTEDAARRNAGDGDRYAARVPVLQAQLETLQAALEALFDDLRAGRKRFVPYRGFKLYGGPGPNAGDTRRD
jgi:hypothetical protein